MQTLLESEYLKALLVIVIGSLILLLVNFILKRRIKKLEAKQEQAGKKISHLNFLRFFQRIEIGRAHV